MDALTPARTSWSDMNLALVRRSRVLLVALAVGITAAWSASAFAAETDSVTVHEGDGDTVRRAALEEAPMPDEEPGTAGAVTLALVVYQGTREIGRFALNGNQGELATDRSPLLRPVVFAFTRSCGGSCSSLYVAAVEVPQNGNPKEIFRRQFFGGSVTVTSNGFTVNEPVYADGEPNCCPSRERVSTFKRRGAGYELARSRVRAKNK